jgi:hypothetical protein
MVKRGFFFWIEMIFLIIIITIVALSFPKSKDGFSRAKDSADLEKLGYGALQNLDMGGVLYAPINFTSSSVYIRKSLPSTIETKIEYFDGAACFSEFGVPLGSCGNFTMPANTVVANYVFAKASSPVTIRLYLRRIF